MFLAVPSVVITALRSTGRPTPTSEVVAMKIRKVSAIAAVMVSVLAPAGLSAQAEITANAGYLSQYYYRGIPQKTSSANAGLDVASGMFSAGTWAADVGDGAEVDLYAGVAFDITDMVNLSLGGTGYFYTGEFDVTYLEANVGVGLGPIAIEWSFGQHSYDPDAGKYSFLGITAEKNGLFATVGTFSENVLSFGDAWTDMFTLKPEDLAAGAGIHGQYLEAGYGFTAGDIDWVISGIWNDSEFSGEYNGVGDPTNELTFVLGLSKTFNLN
jgi:uncharacterized protein (TIGR02001 family)